MKPNHFSTLLAACLLMALVAAPAAQGADISDRLPWEKCFSADDSNDVCTGEDPTNKTAITFESGLVNTIKDLEGPQPPHVPELPEGIDPPSPEDCVNYGAANGQTVAHGMAQMPTVTTEQIRDAVSVAALSATSLCLEDLMPDPRDLLSGDGGDSGVASCVNHAGGGYVLVFCAFFCPPIPKFTKYKVSTSAVDPGSATDDPFVYGAVGCFNGNTPVPPFGVSCSGQGHCENEFNEGVKWMYGSCIHLAAGIEPQMYDRECEW